MAIVINNVMMEKLLHDIKEIRVRALHDIENKLKRALWEDEDIKFSPTALVKNLIRWFGRSPICEEAAVLELLTMLITSKKYGPEIVNYFTSNRIIKELGKIRSLIGRNDQYAELVENLVASVQDVTRTIANDAVSEELTSIAESLNSVKLDNMTDGLTRSSLRQSCHDMTGLRQDPGFYTRCWEIPEPAVAKTLQSLNDSLSGGDQDAASIQHALNYLGPSLKDFPPEFFLQPPYVVLSLVQLVHQRKISVATAFDTLYRLTVALEARIRQLRIANMRVLDDNDCRLVAENVQISISGYVQELFLVGVDVLKEISDDVDMCDTNVIFRLLHVLTGLLHNRPGLTDPSAMLRREISYLIQRYRQQWESNTKSFVTRTKYLLSLQMLLSLMGNLEAEEDFQAVDIDGSVPYNASDYATMNSSSAHRARMLSNDNARWRNELLLAALDYPLRHTHPQLYEQILTCALRFSNKSANLTELLTADEVLSPAIAILRQQTPFSDRELVFGGLKAIETLHVYQSLDLVRTVLKAVGSCSTLMGDDNELKEAADELVVRLLAHGDEEVKRTAYEVCSDLLKDFISQIDEGAILTTRRKTFSKSLPKLTALGMPLSVEILSEIICYGYHRSQTNKQVRVYAETMLLFILNSKTFLHERWRDVQEVVLPVLPLLQVSVEKDAKLGRVLMGLLHPDFELPLIDLVRGNLRLLFHEDAAVREEALTRTLFIMRVANNAQYYAPNVDHIRDTVPNTLCRLKKKYDISKHLASDVYEVSAVRPLLDTLERDCHDPAIRRSALVQLNVMAEDPLLCELLHNTKGWGYILQALDNALREEHYLDYPDSAIPAIGLLTKLCFTIADFRRFLADNINVYYLLVRALLLFHHMPVFKADCCSLLFLLLFSEYALGCGSTVSIPEVCKSLCIPFVSEFHWKHSPFRMCSFLEEILLKERYHSAADDELQTDSILTANRRCGPVCATQQWHLQQDESEAYAESGSGLSYRQMAWRYVRFAFASMWFDGFDNIAANAAKCRRANAATVIDYTELPIRPREPVDPVEETSEIINLVDDTLQFNKALHLQQMDIDLINTTSMRRKCKALLRSITSARSHADVSCGIAALQSNVLLSLDAPLEPLTVIESIKRFLLTPPSTSDDERLLIVVLDLLNTLIHAGHENVLLWVVTLLFEGTRCVLMQLLASKTCSGTLFTKNISLIKNALRSAFADGSDGSIAQVIIHRDDNVIKGKAKQNDSHRNLLDAIFETIAKRLDDDLQQCDIVRMLPLLSLLLVVAQTGSIGLEEKFINHTMNRLCSYIQNIRSITYIGSSIGRNCLLVLGALLETVHTCHLKSKYLKTLAIECTHSSVIMRALGWSVLGKVARTLHGAHAVVKECAYLPGGIHACCISTLLDPQEADLVKESATSLLVNLLSHRLDKESGGTLHKSVQPWDKASNSALNGDPLQTILGIMQKHRLFEQTVQSMAHFVPMEVLENAIEEENEAESTPRVTCDLVRSYALLYASLVELDGKLVEMLVAKGCLQELMNCCSKVPVDPSKSALLMVSAICNLLYKCTDSIKDQICELMSSHYTVVGGLVYLMNDQLYEHLEDKVLYQTTMAIMRLLNVLAMNKIGNAMLNCIFSQLNLKPIVILIMKGISCQNKDYSQSCLRFLSIMILTSDIEESPTSELQSFLSLLELLDMNTQADDTKIKRRSTGNERDKVTTNCTLSDDDDNDQENHNPNAPSAVVGRSKTLSKTGGTVLAPMAPTCTGVESICTTVVRQFVHVCSQDRPENGAIASTVQKRTIYSTLQILLRLSRSARRAAHDTKLISLIIERFHAVYDGIGMGYADFIRKNGDAKKQPVLEELSGLVGILSAWYGSETLVRQNYITELCKIFLKFWPWMSNNRELEVVFMKALAYLTESSILMCRALVQPYPTFPHSILKLVIVTVTSETGKVKGPKSSTMLLAICLRILSNCCSCQEGRSLITKLNVIDNISKLHPSVTKMQSPWISVTRKWFAFWETLTRYDDVMEVRHLTVLGALFRKSSPEIRLLSLEIVRNMAFVASNRPALLASTDFMFILKAVLDGNDEQEQLIVTVAIWKLIANNQKGKGTIKASPIVRRINALLKQRTLREGFERDQLHGVLSIVHNLLHA